MNIHRHCFLYFFAILLTACARSAIPTLPPSHTLAFIPTNPVAASTTASSLVPPTTTSTPPPTLTPSPSATPTSTPQPIPTLTRTPDSISLMAVGDVMLARNIASVSPEAVFAGVQGVFDEADVLAINLECALGQGGQPEPKAYTFLAPPAMAQALQIAGVDVASLANNHALDYSLEALTETRQLLNAARVAPVGAGSNAREARAPILIERNGIRLAFLAYVDVPVETRLGFDTRSWAATENTPGLAWAVDDDIRADVTAAKTLADHVIVLLHSGSESRFEPNSLQRAHAYAAIEAGATLVIGAHPHVLQPIERYQGGLIVYSLGNFVFDGFDGDANDSAILRVQLNHEGLVNYDFVPVIVENGLPRLAQGDETTRIFRRLQP